MKAKINKDKLTLTELECQNSGSVNYYELLCDFDDSWNGLNKEMVLAQGIDGIHRAVIDGKVYIDKEKSGLCEIGFVGYTIENDVKTYQISTNLVTINIQRGAGEVDIIEGHIPTPTEWEVYMAQIQAMIDDIEDMDIDVSKEGTVTTVTIRKKDGTVKTVQILDGEKGEKGDTGERGADATINGVNTLTIQAGENINIEQQGNTMTIKGVQQYYNNLPDKPSINGVTLTNNKTPQDLGLQASQAGKGLSTNDYTDADKSKLAGLENYDDTVITGRVQAVESDITSLQSDKQNVSDENLETTNKDIVSAINEVNSVAKGSNQALSYGNYSTMITAFNSLPKDTYKTGQNIYINTLEVPDLWISSVENTSETYTYTTDEAFVTALATGYVQVGYYRLSMLETQKVDLTEYAKFNDYPTGNKAGVVKSNAGFDVSASTGLVRTITYAYSQYINLGDLTFIGKGTLENVFAGKGLVKATSISSSSTDDNVVTPRAVYSYIQSLDGTNIEY